jgi:thiol-disulfide isomerase/thioredoxin
MQIKRLTILCLLFAACNLYAQLPKDSAASFSGITSVKLADPLHKRNTSLNLNAKPFSLFIFISPECPLCQNYTKTINQLYKQFNQQVAVYGIVPGRAYTAKDIRAFKNKYLTNFDILIDTKQLLTHYVDAAVTPQAILMDNGGNLLYTGAIDDWVQGLGKKRTTALHYYVKDAIEQSLLHAEVTIKKTTAYGCRINDF